MICKQTRLALTYSFSREPRAPKGTNKALQSITKALEDLITALKKEPDKALKVLSKSSFQLLQAILIYVKVAIIFIQ